MSGHEFRDTRAEIGDPAPAGSSTHALDLALARDALAGREAARAQFAERMQCVPRYLCVINARVGRPFTDTELEDLTQETLVEVWRRLDSYAGLASLQTWAYRFCQQVLSSRMRTTRRRPASVQVDPASTDSGRAKSSLDYEPLYAALEKLDPESAAIVRHRHFDRWTFEEIAKRLSKPESSTKVAYQRAITRLRELLGPMRKESGL